jgi:hypothetical protein
VCLLSGRLKSQQLICVRLRDLITMLALAEPRVTKIKVIITEEEVVIVSGGHFPSERCSGECWCRSGVL